MQNNNAIDVDELLSSGNEVDDKKEGKKADKKKFVSSIKINFDKLTFYIREPQIDFSDIRFVVPNTPVFDLFLEFLAYSGKKNKDTCVTVERNFECKTPSIHHTASHKSEFNPSRIFSFKFMMDLDYYAHFNRDCFLAFVKVFNKLYLRFIDKKDENRILFLNNLSIISFTAEELEVSEKELAVLLNLKFLFKCDKLIKDLSHSNLTKFTQEPKFCFITEDGKFCINPYFLLLMFWTANLGYKLINRGFLSCNKLDIGCILCALELCFNANFRNKAYSKSVFFSDECLSKFQTKLPNTIKYLDYLKESSPKNYSPVMLRRKFLSYFKTLQKRGYFHIFIQNSKDGNNCISVADIDPSELQGNRMTARVDFNLKDTKFKYNVIWYSLDKKTKLKQKSTLF